MASAPKGDKPHFHGAPEDIPASEPCFGTTPNGDTRVLIACAMLEDEVMAAYEKCGCDMRVIWVDRSYHDNREGLHTKLQELIDQAEAEGATQVMLAIGLCGNSVVGLKGQRATLAVPRFDDCVNMMLCKGKRTQRSEAQTGVLYFTRGWSNDDTLVKRERAFYVEKYGEKRANRLMKMLYEAYRSVALIDNGCYELDDVRGYAEDCAGILGVDVGVVSGSNEILEKLVSGNWDDDILVCEPGCEVKVEDFNFGGCTVASSANVFG